MRYFKDLCKLPFEAWDQNRKHVFEVIKVLRFYDFLHPIRISKRHGFASEPDPHKDSKLYALPSFSSLIYLLW